MKSLILNLIILLLFAGGLHAQQIKLSGRVTDSVTGEAIPFANIILAGTQVGSITDLNGQYSISTETMADSVVVSCMGYKTEKVALANAVSPLDFRLVPTTFNISEVTVAPGINPALEIMAKVVANKEANDRDKLQSYEYESYAQTNISYTT